MKATIEVPDDLYRKVKAMAALQGRAIRDVTIELFRCWLEQDESSEAPEAAAFDLLKDYCGVFDSGVGDLSSNPRHMEGFGGDSTGDH